MAALEYTENGRSWTILRVLTSSLSLWIAIWGFNGEVTSAFNKYSVSEWVIIRKGFLPLLFYNLQIFYNENIIFNFIKIYLNMSASGGKG